MVLSLPLSAGRHQQLHLPIHPPAQQLSRRAGSQENLPVVE